MPRKKRTRQTEEPADSFGPDMDYRVPGELVVKLSDEGQMAMTEGIPPGPLRRVAGDLPTNFGVDPLDQVLAELGVQSITKVHGPISPTALIGAVEQVGPVKVDELPGISRSQPVERTISALAEELEATYRLRLDPTIDLDYAINRLKSLDEVVEISPNFFRFALVVPNDPMFTTQWGLTKINCPIAWNRTTGSASVIVAVVDTGVDLNHPDLVPNLVPGWDAVDLVGVTPRPGWHWEGDFLTLDNDPQDEVGHGTHVAGTIAAVGNNTTGVTGVTWSCKIMPVRVLARLVRNTDRAVSGSGTAVDVAAGIRHAADHGAHIINLSLGGYNDTFVERDAVAYAISRGCVVVAAMGNDDINTPSYPAAYPDVVAVGAINLSDQRISKANTGGQWGSNTGQHIGVVAPGLSILSTDWDNIYSNKSGTSMATSHVAGVAALIKSCGSTWTGTQIAQILRETARPLRDTSADLVPNDRYGYGLVDAAAAVNRAYVLKLKITDEPNPRMVLDMKPKFADEDPSLNPTSMKYKYYPEKGKYYDEKGKEKFTDEKPKFADEHLSQPAPFILATPHHSNAWLASGQSYTRTSAHEAQLSHLITAVSVLEELAQNGGLAETGLQHLAQLRQRYQQFLAEYQQPSGDQ